MVFLMLKLSAEEVLKVYTESFNCNITAGLDKLNVCQFNIFFFSPPLVNISLPPKSRVILALLQFFFEGPL